MSDLLEIVSRNVDVPVLHPGTGEPTGLVITLYPPDADAREALKKKWTNEAIKLRNRTLTADQIEARSLERIVVATAGWTWGEDADGNQASFGGEQLEFSAVNVRMLYKKVPYIRTQIMEALDDESAAFL